MARELLGEAVAVRLPPQMRKQMDRLARLHERSLNGEIRVAIGAYLEAEKQARAEHSVKA